MAKTAPTTKAPVQPQLLKNSKTRISTAAMPDVAMIQ